MSKMPNPRDYVKVEDGDYGDLITFVSPVDGEEEGWFSDNASFYSPEDLIWCRRIGTLFDTAFRIGWEARGKADE